MALQLWKGNSGSGKTHSIFQHVIEESMKHPELSYIVLVPEQFTLQTQQDLIQMHPNHGILNIDVLSFARLTYRIFEEVGFEHASGVLLDDMGKSLVLRHLSGMDTCQLETLGRNLKKLGYINEVKSVISEFMQYGVGIHELDGMLLDAKREGRELLYCKLRDLRTLYQAFRDYTKENYITTEELLERACEVLIQSEKLKKSVVILDGFTGFTPIQYRLLSGLMCECVDVYVTVLVDTLEPAVPMEEHELFYMGRKMANKLKSLAIDAKVPIRDDYVIKEDAPIRFKGHPALIHLERNLFRTHITPYPVAKEQSEIEIISAADPYDEMRYVAVKIQELIRNRGYQYKDIAIITGDLETYAQCAKRMLKRYEIPCFVDKTQPILLNPFIEYLRALVSIYADDFSYEGMFRYLKSSLVPIEAKEIDELENYVLACGIRGRHMWERRFTRRTRSIDEEALQRLDRIRVQIMDSFKVIDGYLDGHSHKPKAGDHVKAFYAFIFENHLQEQLKVREEAFLRANEHEKAREYGQIYEQVMDLFDKIYALLGEELISIEEFGQLLDAGFDEIRIGIIPQITDYVQIGDITRTRIRDIKALFFVGVNDGIVPQASSYGGMLSDMDREFFLEREHKVELAPTARMQAYTQRFYLYMMMTKPKEYLSLSYAGMSTGGKQLRPSYLIESVRKCFPGLVIKRSSELDVWKRAITKEAAQYELRDGISRYFEDGNEEYLSLFQCMADIPDNSLEIEKIVKDALSMSINSRQDTISKAVANALFGKEITTSVTRLEAYAKCAYQHFLNYGLTIKERELFDFQAKDMGILFHDALQMYAALMEEKKLNWFEITKAQSMELVETAVKRCVAKEEYAAVYSSFRTQYMIDRMLRITSKTVDILSYQIKKGKFIPRGFEVGFYSENDFEALNFSLSDQEKLHLRGRIDRLDLYEDDRNIYVKIIDYKSGMQSFDLAAVYEGLELQLVVYLNAAMETEQKKTSKEVIPAGVLYYHIDDPIVEADQTDSEEEISSKIKRELRMKGLVNSNPEIVRLMDNEFESKSEVIPVGIKKDGTYDSHSKVASTDDFSVISKYVNMKIMEIGRRMVNGEIQKNPESCTYCSYRSICQPDVMAEDIKEEEESQGLKNEEIIQKMREKIS